MGLLLFQAIGIWVALPLLAIAVAVTWVSGNLLFVAVWVGFAVAWVVLAVFVGPLND